jgi:hypothetical protein
MILVEPIPFLGYGYIAFVAAPFIRINLVHQSGTQGIPVNISNRLQQIAVRVDENGLVAPSKKLTITIMAAVVSLSVYTV